MSGVCVVVVACRSESESACLVATDGLLEPYGGIIIGSVIPYYVLFCMVVEAWQTVGSPDCYSVSSCEGLFAPSANRESMRWVYSQGRICYEQRSRMDPELRLL